MNHSTEIEICARANTNANLASLEQIRSYFGSWAGGPPLHPDFLAECSESELRRMAYLAGDRFIRWVEAQSIKEPPK